jgi:hypothetical protein
MSNGTTNTNVLRLAVRIAAVAALCWLLPATALANRETSPGNDEHPGNGKPDSVTMSVDVLRALEYTLSPTDPLEQSVDPAARVTIVGTGWQLFAIWDGPRRTATASMRECGVWGGWKRLSSTPVLIAESPESGKGEGESQGKGRGHKTTTVLDLELLMHLGEDGADPWTVAPGDYSGHVRFLLRAGGGCDWEAPDTEPSLCPTTEPAVESTEATGEAGDRSLGASDTALAETAVVPTDSIPAVGATETPDATSSIGATTSDLIDPSDDAASGPMSSTARTGSEADGADETSAEATRTPAADPPEADAPLAAPPEVGESEPDAGAGSSSEVKPEQPSQPAEEATPGKAKPPKAPPKPSEPETKSPDPDDAATSDAP